MRGQQLIEGSKSAAVELTRNRIGTRQIAVHDSEQAYRLSILLQLFQDACVITPERTHANHGHLDQVVVAQKASPLG